MQTNPKWLGLKIMLYATAIAAGLGIRLTLRPFGAAFGTLMTKGLHAGGRGDAEAVGRRLPALRLDHLGQRAGRRRPRHPQALGQP